jgi:hypothetical protein
MFPSLVGQVGLSKTKTCSICGGSLHQFDRDSSSKDGTATGLEIESYSPCRGGVHKNLLQFEPVTYYVDCTIRLLFSSPSS